MNIYWFRRDLRLEDNKGLLEALQSSESVLPIFIFDVAILNQLPKDDARVTFIHKLLSEINSELQKKGKSLAVFYGNPIEIIKNLIVENHIQNLYANRDYEPYARKRDKEIYKFLASHNILDIATRSNNSPSENQGNRSEYSRLLQKNQFKL